VFSLRAEEIREVDGQFARLWGHTALPISDLTGVATCVSILSILLNVCYTGDHPLWVMARSGLDRMATVALSSLSCWRLGPGRVTAPACIPYQACAINQEVL